MWLTAYTNGAVEKLKNTYYGDTSSPSNVRSTEETVGIITYIDVAAFDSINHSYILESLKM